MSGNSLFSFYCYQSFILLYLQDRENRSLDGAKRGGKDQDFSVRVKDLEAKLRGALQGKKPKDLLRAIGKNILKRVLTSLLNFL